MSEELMARVSIYCARSDVRRKVFWASVITKDHGGHEIIFPETVNIEKGETIRVVFDYR